MTEFLDSFSEEIWFQTYKHHSDNTVDDTIRRVATAIASVENTQELQQEWTEKFIDMMSDFKVVPGGRIIVNAGTEFGGSTLLNCFVSPRLDNDIDSIDGIYKHLWMQAKTLKSEGGWGENFSYIRPRGSFIEGVGVESPGAVKFMELFDKSSEIVTSGSGKKSTNKRAKNKIRKGAQMAVLDVWHPDVIEFITAKQTQGRLTKFNMSVNCTDEFMKKLDFVDYWKSQDASKEYLNEIDQWDLKFPDTTHPNYKAEWTGDITKWERSGYPVNVFQTVSATWLWDLIMKSTYTRAEPGVLFLDRANHYNPLSYKETIYATNPCISKRNWIQTDGGPKTVEELINVPYNAIIEGKKYSCLTGFFKTGHKELFKLQTVEGYSLEVTEDHKIYSIDTDGSLFKKPLNEYNPGDKIKISNNRRHNYWNGNGNFSEGYLMGLLVGDGSVSNNETTLSIWPGQNPGAESVKDYVLECIKDMPKGPAFKGWQIVNRNDEFSGEYRMHFKSLTELAGKYGLLREKTITDEIHHSSSDFHRGFLSGLFDADGSVQGSKESGRTIRAMMSNQLLLESCQQMLQRLGICSRIYYNRNIEENKMMPDGKGGLKEYHIQAQHELSISKDNLLLFNEMVGFKDTVKSQILQEHIQSYTKGPYTETFLATFHSITSIGYDDVYDCTINDIHAYDANGLMISNCGEQVLAPGGCCDLGSLNLTQFVKDDLSDFDYSKMKQYLKYLVRFLDNVNTYSNAPLPEYKENMEKKRRIGCGLMGWGSSLLMMKIRFGSEHSQNLRDKLMKFFSHIAYEASIDLAMEKGMFELCDPEQHAEAQFLKQIDFPEEQLNRIRQYGIRNSAVLSCQPTGNSAIYANIVSGGIEPIFMPEYVRTVILPSAPDEIIDQCPKWYEGEFFETDLFEFTSEGDDQILRAVGPSGTVYKIDKNRGLTKEVLCQDYGVRFLSSRGEWDPNADYVATTTQLTCSDHVNDLEGFAKYIDSAISKTINLPNDITYDDFKQVYRKAYDTGYIKGITTYRAGTMATVLSAKEEKYADKCNEEIILDNVKMRDDCQARVKTLRAEGRKWYLTVVMNESNTRPIALFVQTNHSEKNVITNNAVEVLYDMAMKKGIPEQFVDDTMAKTRNDSNSVKITRMISLCLRHGVLIKNIVAALDRVDGVFAGSFVFHIKRFLASFIKDGETVEGMKCESCGSSRIIYTEGCMKCADCSGSKCG